MEMRWDIELYHMHSSSPGQILVQLCNSFLFRMAVCGLTTVYVLDFPSEAQKAPSRECKATDFEVPETFLNCLQNLSSCFLKDIAGKEGNRGRSQIFFFGEDYHQTRFLFLFFSHLAWFDVVKALFRPFLSIVPCTLLPEVWGCVGCLDFGKATFIISALPHSVYHWQDIQLLPSSGLTDLTQQAAPVLCPPLQCCDWLSE